MEPDKSNNTYCRQRGGASYQIRIFPWSSHTQEGYTGGTVVSNDRTRDGLMPGEYSVFMYGGGLVNTTAQGTYLVTADRDDDICTTLRCTGGQTSGAANPFCGLQASSTLVTVTP